MSRPSLSSPVRRARLRTGRRLAPPDDAARERAARWSAYFHRFTGWPHGRHELPGDLVPMSCRQAFETLSAVPDERTDTVQRSVSHLLVAGWEPERRHLDRLAAVARAACDDATDPDDPVQYLRARAPVEPVGRVVEARPVLPPPSGQKTIAYPSRVTIVDGVATVRTEALVPRPLDRVAELIQPQNWHRLGPFFRSTDLLEREETKRRDELVEHFVVDWNSFNVQEFRVHLHVDYGEQDEADGGKTARTDYAILYEEDDQILVDDGFGQARRIPGHPGWTHYIGEKKVKFASPMLNLLSPAITAMLLETNTDWLLKALPEPGGRAS
jgi:hypothetical protein